MDKKEPLLLVVTGFPRSGTTLLTQIVSSHPEIEVSFEFRNLRLPMPHAKYIEQLRNNWRERRIVEWHGRLSRLSLLKSGWFYYGYRFLMQRYQGQEVQVEMALQTLQQLFPNKRYLGDKHPRYTERIPQFAQLSYARQLVIYRDVRHVIPSFIKKFEDDREPASIAENWSKTMELIAEHQASLHLIRYEDLLKEPQKTIEALANYLELDPKGFRTDVIRSYNSGDYRQKLSEADIAAIEAVAGEQMRYWGYL
jgi:hypothetical protein